MRRALFAVILALGLAGCSRYDYTEAAAGGVRQPVRVDRISGRTEILTSNAGWVELKPSPSPTPIPSAAPCTEEELRRAQQPIPQGRVLDMEKYLLDERDQRCREASLAAGR